MKYREVDDLFVGVGYGKTSVSQVLEALLPEDEDRRKIGEPSKFEQLIQRVTRKAPSPIRIQGVENILIRFGKCCNPLPGDSVVGFITRGRGVTVHAIGCPHAMESDPARRIEVEWDTDTETTRPVKIRVVCDDRPGLLASISKVISSASVNISKAQASPKSHATAEIIFELAVRDVQQLESINNSIERVKGVLSVERVRG